jgi:hypothetical protein
MASAISGKLQNIFIHHGYEIQPNKVYFWGMKNILAVVLLSFNIFSLLAQPDWAIYPEYNYFFSDEKPVCWISNEASTSRAITLLLKSGRVIFQDTVGASSQKSFLLLPLEREEFEIVDDGFIQVPIRSICEQQLVHDTLLIKTLPRKDNAVRIHFPSGALETSLSTQHHFVGNEQRAAFFPFGFYARERDDFDWILRTEAMNGFNLYSPYQSIEDSTLSRRKNYMDLCAKLGVRVNYNLQQICPLKESDSPEVKKRKMYQIQQEVRTFKDHPALLSWYVSDEPDGQFIKPSELSEAVALIRKLDPHHPIAMVFADPKPSLPYQDLLDIVMTDPYPIPGNSVVNAGEYLKKLKEYYQFKKHIWIVPQAFGGQEFWQREPTPEELRAMVYLGVINGSRASQAFIRHVGQSFPKNPAMWSAYHQSARELQFLLNDLEYQNEIKHYKEKDWWAKMKVESACFRGENPNDRLFILVNVENTHKIINCPMGEEYAQGEWHFIHENRKVKSDEMFEWVLNPFEVKIIRYEERKLSLNTMMNKEWEGNLIRDFSFEQWTSPTIPTACYLHMSKEHGATALLDRSISHHGEVSLRLNNLGGQTPENNSQEISFYQFQTVANHAYVLSFWAYAEQTANKIGVENKIALRIEKPWGKFIWHDTVAIQSGWHRYDISYVPNVGEDRNMLELRLLQEGFVWLDQIQWVESPTITLAGEIFDSQRTIKAQAIGEICPLDKITYVFQPNVGDTIFRGNLSQGVELDSDGKIEVKYLLPNGQYQTLSWPVALNFKKWKTMEYAIEPSLKYLAGGKKALMDGQMGEFVWDGKWQGFEGTDFEVILEKDTEDPTSLITIRALSKKSAWVYWPASVTLYASEDGLQFQEVQTISIPAQNYQDDDGVKVFDFPILQQVNSNFSKMKYYKIQAKSNKILPSDHPFVGEKSWLFIDEILLR